VLTMIEEPARGPAGPEGTPEGVRPTIDADGRNWENYVALSDTATATAVEARIVQLPFPP
jgi:hypothetical protein